MKLSTIESIQSKLAELFGKYTKKCEFQIGYLTPGKFCWNVMSTKCTKNIKDKEAMKVKAKQRKWPNESTGAPSISQTKRAEACGSHLEKMDKLSQSPVPKIWGYHCPNG